MKYYSLNYNSPSVDFKTAVINGIAPDRGLYFPRVVPSLKTLFFNSIENLSNNEIAFQVIRPYVKEVIPNEKLREIIHKTLTFDFPIENLNNSIYSLELFHGPTLAFKDVGAFFMARCLSYFNSKNQKSTVLVATSGDTGGAVAKGFSGVTGVDVVILYPAGKVSNIQEKQLTTMGSNIKALEVNGVFDDCQEMVKTAFLDLDLKFKNLTSANSINIARWLPQMFYYFITYKNLKSKNRELIFSVPSGNFGNICAGMLAKKMGLPIKIFIAATNINDTIPNYLTTGNYKSKESKPTISNAMDVGNPSNFIRIQELYQRSLIDLKNDLKSYSYNDEQTQVAMKELFNKFGYISEPHGAIGYLGLKNYFEKFNDSVSIGVFLETAHPVKFLDIVEKVLKIKLDIPNSIYSILNKEKLSLKINTYEDLKNYLITN